MCGEDITAGEPPGYLARLFASDDRQATDIFVHDVVGRFAKRVVLEDDRWRALEDLVERQSLAIGGVKDVAAGDDPDQVLVTIKNREALMSCAHGVRPEPRAHGC